MPVLLCGNRSHFHCGSISEKAKAFALEQQLEDVNIYADYKEMIEKENLELEQTRVIQTINEENFVKNVAKNEDEFICKVNVKQKVRSITEIY